MLRKSLIRATIEVLFFNRALRLHVDRFGVPVILAIVSHRIVQLKVVRFEHIDQASIEDVLRVSWVLMLLIQLLLGWVVFGQVEYMSALDV